MDKNDHPHKIDDMESRLYRRRPDERSGVRFDSLSPRKFKSTKAWKTTEKQAKKVVQKVQHPSLFKKFFFWSLGFAAIALIFGLIMFFTGGNTVSNANIEINVLGNSFARGGEELPLEVEIVNNNSATLELADLFVEYEKGGDARGGAEKVRDLYSLESIAAGRTVAKNIFTTLYGEEGSIKTIDFTLQYRIRGSNAIFVKKNSFSVTISSAPVTLSVDAPESVSPNQKLSFVVKVQSNAEETLQGLLLNVVYPSGFKFESAIPEAAVLNNTWEIGDLPPGGSKEVRVTGTVFGQDGEDRAFRIYTGAKSEKDHRKIGLTYNSLLQRVSLVKPFLAARLLINGSGESVVPVSGREMNVSVNWSNNLPTQVTDAEVTVKLSGNAVDLSNVTTRNGFFDSSRNVVVWNKTTEGDLGVIEPSDGGTLDFSVGLLPLWSAGSEPLINPSVKVSVSIKGKEREAGGVIHEVTNFEDKTAVVSSEFGFSAEAYYSTGPFTNTGAIPPIANQPTTYTVTWTATNSANTLSDGIATATLPTYVDWVGTTYPGNENIEYDRTTRTVRWRIGQIARGAGLSTTAKRASFQVRLLPSTSQIGSVPKLILETSASARDSFTRELLSATWAPLSTQLNNDPGFPPGGGVVTN